MRFVARTHVLWLFVFCFFAVTATSAQALTLSKRFTDDPVAPGDTVTLEFTVTNDGDVSSTGITFTDDLEAALAGLAAIDLPKSNICGAGSTLSGAGIITLTGGTLSPHGSATFDVTLQVPFAAPDGTFTNTTSSVSGIEGGGPVSGDPATDDLQITALRFSKSFDGPTAAGGTVTLTFTIENLSPSSGAVSLSFSDDLNAVLPGLVATGLPQSHVCGAGSQLSGTSLITFSGGSVAKDTSCSFSVDLQVPAGVSPGTYPNATSDLFKSGMTVCPPATSDLTVEPQPAFSKSFGPHSITCGGVSTLTFTIDNTASSLAATDIDFTDNLPAGVTVATPANASTTCTGGTLTAVPGTSVITYTGGTVAAGTTCTIEVNVTSSTADTYTNTTGDLTSSSGNSGTATSDLTVEPQPAFSKSFGPHSITCGGVSTLTFTIDNTASSVAATDIDFTDNLPAGVTVATPANASTTCTGGTLTAVPGTSVITYTGGTVAAGTTCTIEVNVTSSTADTYTNTTGDLTSSSGNSGTATDALTVTTPAPIPTLNEWGVVVLSLLIASTGAVIVRRRSRSS